MAFEGAEAVQERASLQELRQVGLRLEGVDLSAGLEAAANQQREDPDVRADIQEDGIGTNETQNDVDVLGFVKTAIQQRAGHSGIPRIDEDRLLIRQVDQRCALVDMGDGAPANKFDLIDCDVQIRRKIHA